MVFYNSENQYDLSPYYSFDDEKAELQGNINGAVIIGNNVRYADNVECCNKRLSRHWQTSSLRFYRFLKELN